MGPYSVVTHYNAKWASLFESNKNYIVLLQINTQKGLNKIVTLVLAHIDVCTYKFLRQVSTY